MVLTHQQIAQKVNQMIASNQPLQPIYQQKNTAQSSASSTAKATVIRTQANTSKKLNLSPGTSYTVSGKQNTANLIPASDIKNSETVPTNTYNTYDASNIQHAKEMQTSGSPLQKATSTIYLSANSLANKYESFVDSKNKYGTAFSKGEKANTGDSIRDFIADVQSNLVLMPSNLLRSVSAGVMATGDMTTKNVEASVQSIKTGDLSISKQQQAKTNTAVLDAVKKSGESLGQTLTDPAALVAMGLTLPLGGVVTGTAKGLSKGVSTLKSIKVTKTTAGNIGVSGKTVTIGKTTITKGTTKTGGKTIEITKRNEAGQVTAGIKKTKETVNIKQGNLVLSGERKLTVVQAGNRKIATRTVKGTEAKITSKQNPSINITQKVDTLTIKSGKTKQTVYAKKDTKGNISTKERISKSRSETTTAKQYVKSGNRARIGTKTNTKSGNIKEYIRNGETKKRVQKGEKSESESIDLDINIGNTAKQLPGKTGKAKGKYAVKIQGKQLILLGKRMGTKKGISYRAGNTAGRITISKADKRTLTTKETAKIDAKTKTRSTRIKSVDKPAKTKAKPQQKPAGTINGGSGTKTTKGTDNTNNHASGNTMYQSKTKGKSSTEPAKGQPAKAVFKPQQTQKSTQAKTKSQDITEEEIMQKAEEINRKRKPILEEILKISAEKNKQEVARLLAKQKAQAKQQSSAKPTPAKTTTKSAPKKPTPAKTTTKSTPKKPTPAKTTTKSAPKQKQQKQGAKRVRKSIYRTIIATQSVTTKSKAQQKLNVQFPQKTNTSGNTAVNSTTTATKTGTTNAITSGTTTRTGTGTGNKPKTGTTNKTNSGNKPKSNTKVKMIVAPMLKTAQKPKQEQKQEVKQKRAVKPKTATHQRKKNKKVIRLSDDDYKKRRKTTKKTKKTAIRKETINQFGWLGYDSKKAAKPKRITL